MTTLGERIFALSEDLLFLAPEIVLAFFLLLFLTIELTTESNKFIFYVVMTIFPQVLIFGLIWIGWDSLQRRGGLIGGVLLLDNWALFFKSLFAIGGAFTALLFTRKRKYYLLLDRNGELFIVLIGLLMGVSLMVMAVNLLMIYLLIELVSICSYILTGIFSGRKKAEGALKYVLFGGVASATMLYGMSWLYGFTGTLDITSEQFIVGLQAVAPLPLTVAVVMVLGGFVFKLGAFPFHIWSPDVYEGAPTPVVAVFSTLPKLAALIVISRFIANTHAVAAFDWQLWLGVIAILSMTVGNFSALWQKDAKRMMAYSSIAHAGFLLVGLLSYSVAGNVAMIFYASVYLLMNFGAFLLIIWLQKMTGSANIREFGGLGGKYPYLAALVLIVMVALTGLPPTAGFSAKLLIFSSLWDTWQEGGNPLLLWVFIFGLFNTVLALFYYLKIPYYLFFKNSQVFGPLAKPHRSTIVLGTIFILPLLLLFFKPDWLLGFLNNANFVF